MSIRVRLLDPRNYALTIAPGSLHVEEKKRISDLPVRQAEYEHVKHYGCDMFKHWVVPRVDVGEILRRWDDDEIDGDDYFWRDVNIYDKYQIPQWKIPTYAGDIDWKFEPKSYQEKYIRISHDWPRLVCAFSTGSGKTWSSLQRAMCLGVKRLFVCTIINMLEDWEEDIFQFFGQRPVIYQGPGRKKLLSEVERSPFVLTTYEAAHEIPFPDGEDYFNQFIFDESDVLTNTETKRWQNMLPIFDHHTWKKPRIGVQACTATPYGNTPETIWPAYYIVHPYLAGSLRGFQNRFQRIESWKEQKVKHITSTGKVVWQTVVRADKVVAQNTKALKKKSDACVITDDGNEFPFERIIKVIDCPLTEQQEIAYKAIRDEAVADFNSGIAWDTKKMKSQMVHVLKCCEGLYHFEELGMQDSSKMRRVRKALNDCIKTGRKCVVFSPLRPGLDLLAEQYIEYGVPYNGDMNRAQKMLARMAFAGCRSDKEREEYAKAKKRYNFPFEPGEALFMFAVTHNITARGMNLHKMCSFAIHLTVSSSARAMTQAYGRIVRIGQKEDTETWYMLSNSEAEHMWYQMVVGKQDQGRALLKGANDLSRQQYKQVLRKLRQDKLAGGLVR